MKNKIILRAINILHVIADAGIIIIARTGDPAAAAMVPYLAMTWRMKVAIDRYKKGGMSLKEMIILDMYVWGLISLD